MSTFGPTTSRTGFRQVLTPLGVSRKRKDRDAALGVPTTPSAAALSPRPPSAARKPKAEPTKPKPSSCNRDSSMILAGYLAHEFLTRGTLLGECMDPTPAPRWEEETEEKAACREVAGRLVMGDSGARIPGIVNPTQLAGWLQTKP